MSDGDAADGGTDAPEGPTNDGQQFDRLPTTEADRVVAGRPTREEVLDWWETRFEIDRSVFTDHTFWEKGNGKIWAFAADLPTPIDVEAVGITFLHARQEHWKPTTDAAQRFGNHADQNVIELSGGEATAFAAGHDQDLPRWEGDWGYLIAAHEIAGDLEPIGVGLYVYGELRSLIPKGRQEALGEL